MKSLQHGEPGGGADIGVMRLLVVFEPDGADDGAGNFLGKRGSQGEQRGVGTAMREGGLNNVTLARKLCPLRGEARRLLDLDYQTRSGTLKKALWSSCPRQILATIARLWCG